MDRPNAHKHSETERTEECCASKKISQTMKQPQCKASMLKHTFRLATTIFFILFFAITAIYAQQSPITIKWTAELGGKWYPLDKVLITNKSNGDTMTVYYPDTVFTCYNDVGITQLPFTSNGLRVYPNPFSNTTQVEFSLARHGETGLVVYDLLGREIVRQVFVLESGTHSFTVSLPNGMYILSLQTADGKCAARLLSSGNETPSPKIVYSGALPPLESLGEVKANNADFSCKYGDTLILQCFITESELFVEERIVHLTENAFISFHFSCEDTIAFTEYTLMLEAISWGNLTRDSLYIINSNEELFALFNRDTLPPFDTTNHTLLCVWGWDIRKNVVLLKNYCTSQYILNITVHSPVIGVNPPWFNAIIISKVYNNTDIIFNFYKN
jgi:hypothetical protein